MICSSSSSLLPPFGGEWRQGLGLDLLSSRALGPSYQKGREKTG